MKRPKQLSFLDEKTHRPGTKARLIQRGLGFGGALNYRKKPRPFDKRKSIHLILRSPQLSGARSLLKSNRRTWIETLILQKVQKYQAKLYRLSVNSNHIHLLMRFEDARGQSDFLRDLAGCLALKIRKTFRMGKENKIWEGRPFSRLVSRGAFTAIMRYIEKNQLESLGLCAYTARPISELNRSLENLAFARKLRRNTTEADLL